MTKKQTTAADLMAQILAFGAKSLEELAEIAADSTRANAAEKIETRLMSPSQSVSIITTDDDGNETTEEISLSESWASRLFDLFSDFRADFKCEEVNKRGRGTDKSLESKVEIVTPDGVGFIRLTRDA